MSKRVTGRSAARTARRQARSRAACWCVLDARTGQRVLGSTRQVAFDWSLSGDSLGVATATEIDVYGPDRSRTPTFVIPVSVSAPAWRAR